MCLKGHPMGSLKEQLGLKIKDIRRKKNIKQYKLAELADVEPKTISRIEKGHSYPSFELLEKIADVLDAPIHTFFMFNDETDIKAVRKQIKTALPTLKPAQIKIISEICEL